VRLFGWRRSEPSEADPRAPASESDAQADVQPEEGAGVPGERGIPSVNQVRSVQSRVSSVLVVTVAGGLAAGLLIWYYSGALTRSGRAQQLAEAAAKRRAQNEAALPSLGVIRPPRDLVPPHDSTLDQLLGPPPPLPVTDVSGSTAHEAAASGPPRKSRAQLELERQLSGPVLAGATDRRRATESGVIPEESSPMGNDSGPGQVGNSGELGGSAGSEDGQMTLASLLKPTPTVAVRARVLPTQRFLIPKGAFIDCTLETAISSSLPGMTTCITATDTFSADGTVVLLERGSKLVGETRGEVQQGQPRLFVLWTEARTPTGVVVPLASPGTDELGRSGLSGSIDRHWWLRFGSAILITVIDGAIQGATQSRGSGGTIVLNPSGTSTVATEVLRDSLNIRPTIEKAQGDRIEILVARDVDFRSVYAVHADPGAP
jgi:type IV secretion system protein VirB10